MGRILSSFSYSLLSDDDPNRIAKYTLIYQDLNEGGHALPLKTSDTITHDELELHLQTLAGNKLKEEVVAHPVYYGVTPDPTTVTVKFFQTLDPEDEYSPVRAAVAWWRIPSTPNFISEVDVISALEI